jgi:hypothetical protein
MLEEEAKKRQAATQFASKGERSAPIDTDHENKGRSREIAARAANVGSSSVDRALQVKRSDPALFEQIKEGTVTARSPLYPACSSSCAAEVWIHLDSPLLQQPFRDVIAILVLCAPSL